MSNPPQLPYDFVQKQNVLLKKVCELVKLNRREADVLLRILDTLDMDTYTWNDPEHFLNYIVDKHGNKNMIDFCSETPEVCDVMEFSVQEIGLLAKLTVGDFQRLVCNLKFKTKCKKGDQNCNVGSGQDMVRWFCDKTCKDKSYKEFHRNYTTLPYKRRHDEFYDRLCASCDKKSPDFTSLYQGPWTM